MAREQNTNGSINWGDIFDELSKQTVYDKFEDKSQYFSLVFDCLRFDLRNLSL
jgi:hypothetical protein